MRAIAMSLSRGEIKRYHETISCTRCNIYISRLCYDVSVRLSLSVTEVHWRIIANVGSNSDPTLPRIVVAGTGHLNNISHYASHC